MGNPILRIVRVVWTYLHQPLFEEGTVMNPIKFPQTYRKQLLERCFEKEYEAERKRIYLEICWSRSSKIL